ncbi:MAG TPA: thiol:disulfide interchange protein DsbA/DsbL [Gammaproteobacteria bacterium]
MRVIKPLFPALLALALAACEGNAPDSAADPGLESGQATLAPAAAPEAEDGAESTQEPTSARFQLGTHYRRLSPTQPTSSSPDRVEVAEIFWYGCPHCYAFEPYIARWQAEKPAYVSFVRVPAVWNPLLRLHARAFYTAQALGKGEAMHEAFFTEIHENGNPLDSEEALAEFFARFGVDADAFRDAFDSFDVNSKLQRADELNRRYEITSVPSIVVNGKYTTNATMAGGHDQLIELIGELVEAERSAD